MRSHTIELFAVRPRARVHARRWTRRVIALVALLVAVSLLATACGRDAPTSLSPEAVAAAPPARAFGIWTPGASDGCTAAVHDRYATVGPDGKRYPTWHPPVDPLTGCSFGHEHGRDPHGSALYREVGDLPFGYANEQLDASGLGLQRHEDHVGHKVEWENDLRIDVPGSAGALSVRCDVLVKLHQGTHSRDAFTNNLHELMYHIRCSDRTEMHVTMLAAIGRPGEFERSCGGTVQAGVATPANSPAGGGHRKIPDASCVVSRVLVASGSSDFGALHESWETHNELKTPEGRRLATFDPYFQVFRPSRYYDPAMPNAVGRPVALCAATTPDGRRARSSECEGATITDNGILLSVGYDDPRSRFNGVRRQVDINNNRIDNAGGPTVWYTDPLGRNARTTPFPGSIRQTVAAVSNDYGVNINGPVIGGGREYGGAGVRAPN